MAAPASPTRPEWRPGHIPRLSYRNPLPPEEQEALRELHSRKGLVSAEHSSAKPLIREIREAMPSQPPQSAGPRGNPAAPTSQKRKSSIFGAFFVKEPTQVALNQVAAQIIAQHGSTSATRVPNVSMEKMPEYVPKVNSKWDGIPEAVKIKEKQEKERQKAARRRSMTSDSRGFGADSDGSRGRLGNRSADDSSSSSTLGSRCKSAGSQGSNSNGRRFYAMSVNSSGDLASQQRSDERVRPSSGPKQSLRSPSSTSLPETSALSPNAILPPPAIPARYQRDGSPRTQSSPSADIIRVGSPHAVSLLVEGVSEHTSSPTSTVQRDLPVTPPTAHLQSPEPTSGTRTCGSGQEELQLRSAGSNVLGPPAALRKKAVQVSSGAFLAGEAHPFELPEEGPATESVDVPLGRTSLVTERIQRDVQKRPDSSRGRLGLHASMRLRTDAAPWDITDAETNKKAVSPRSSMPASPKLMLPKAFGKANKA